ncbi:NAC domain-containing protein 83 [Artemisia annua]|uniref:NAC domain-containing protein 83 n=1 Tax=Artemisia annua TaxID=35608 RepID=A0A2U1PRV0_ARTAN|nr:NAC domain-containing protein 83 [Artemisia annua]
MDKVNFVKNGVLRLPPGFRFHPTDEELVVQYLRRKVHSSPLPASIIPEVDVCKSDPWDLPGDVENERFFFSTREVKYPNGNRSNRATLSGYWKATGLDKQIVSSSSSYKTSNNNQQEVVVGMKKTLVFYKGKPPSGARTDWVMHEYRLASQPKSQTTQGAENWVLCRIFLKKRGNKKEEEKEYKETIIEVGGNVVTNNNVEMKPKMKPVFYDFLATISTRKEKTGDLNLVPAYSSSGSSGITEATACGNGSGEDETSDHVSSF